MIDKAQLRIEIGIPATPRPPRPRNMVVVDFNHWREEWVEYEEMEAAARLENARGSCDLVAPCRRNRRAPRSPAPGRGSRDMSDPNEQAKAILVSASVAGWAVLDQMSKRQIRVALEDLQARLRRCAEFGTSRKMVGEVGPAPAGGGRDDDGT